MCGIFGYIGRQKINLKSCTDIIKHRGPDSEGFLWFQSHNNIICKDWTSDKLDSHKLKIAMGFRRLAIIDLQTVANQPLYNDDESMSIIFNGEVYNYIEIRNELLALGIKFNTNSDTEVILKSYMQWGENCLQRFNGMWAFVILDFKTNKVFASRDRFGVKPFYYHYNGDRFICASEIKQFWEAGLNKEINENVIKDFLMLGLVNYSNETFYKEIMQLPGGHFINISFDEDKITAFEIKPYWNLAKNDSYRINPKWTYEKAKTKFLELFKSSILLRFRSDVPVGSCLSGGLDSSSIVSVAASEFKTDIYAFSSVFGKNPRADESHYINEVKKKYSKINLNFCTTEPEQILKELDIVLWHQDEPFSTFSILAQWNVMKLARQRGVTVLLDGQGGDEVLAGYRKYYGFFLKELLSKRKLVEFISACYYLVKNREFNFFNKQGWKKYLGWKERVDFLSAKGNSLKINNKIGIDSAADVRDKMRDDILKFSYPPLLRFEDRNSMAFSIEARVPFMDYRLVEFLHSQPTEFLIRSGYTKAILRDSLKGVLPDIIRKRISKLGFDTPQDEWMAEYSFKEYFKEYFYRMKNPYLDHKEIYEDFLFFPKSKLSSTDFSRLYIFDRWFQINFAN